MQQNTRKVYTHTNTQTHTSNIYIYTNTHIYTYTKVPSQAHRSQSQPFGKDLTSIGPDVGHQHYVCMCVSFIGVQQTTTYIQTRRTTTFIHTHAHTYNTCTYNTTHTYIPLVRLQILHHSAIVVVCVTIRHTPARRHAVILHQRVLKQVETMSQVSRLIDLDGHSLKNTHKYTYIHT